MRWFGSHVVRDARDLASRRGIVQLLFGPRRLPPGPTFHPIGSAFALRLPIARLIAAFFLDSSAELGSLPCEIVNHADLRSG